MRDSGREDVRAYSREQERQLDMEKGGAEAWRGGKEYPRAKKFAEGCMPLAGRRGTARVEMLSLEKRAGHRQEGTAARWEALGICKDLKPPGTCPKITEWKKDIKI